MNDSEYCYEKTVYTEVCKSCNKMHEVLTQADNDPEYYTKVYVKCDCGVEAALESK